LPAWLLAGFGSELAFANAMHQLDAGDGSSRIPEAFEPEHYVHPRFDVPMILLDQVVQVFRGSQFRSLGQRRVGLHLADRSMRCRVAVQSDRCRSASLSSGQDPRLHDDQPAALRLTISAGTSIMAMALRAMKCHANIICIP
jgi:hypothetical protein